MNKRILKLIILGLAVLILVLIGVFFWVQYPELVLGMILVFKMFFDLFVKLITFNMFTLIIFILLVIFVILTKIYDYLPNKKKGDNKTVK